MGVLLFSFFAAPPAQAAACATAWASSGFIDASCSADASIDWTGGTIWVGYNAGNVTVDGAADPSAIIRPGQNVGSLVFYDHGSWKSLINQGEMSGLNVGGMSRVEIFINQGHMRTGIQVASGSSIGTVVNLGTMAASVLHPDVNITTAAQGGGIIDNLINAQAGLTLGGYYDTIYLQSGVIPTRYYTYFSTPSNFGTIHFKYLGSYNLSTYGLRIAPDTSYVTGTYAAVLTADQRLTIANLEAVSGIKYKLIDRNGDGRIWDLVLETISPTRYSDPARAWGNRAAIAAGGVVENNESLRTIFDGANLVTDQHINAALAQSTPALAGAGLKVTHSLMSDISRIVQSRLNAQRGMSSGDDFLGDRQVWMKYWGSRARQDGRESMAGFRTETYGMTLGGDRMFGNTLRFGVAFSYAQANLHSSSDIAPQKADMSLFQLDAYGDQRLGENTNLSFQLGLGQGRNKSQRNLIFTGDTAHARYNSETVYLGSALAHTMDVNAQTTLIPSLRVDYTRIRSKGYQESGAGLLNLAVDGHTAQQLQLGVDGRLNYQLNSRSSLNVNFGVAYDTLAKRDNFVATFAGAPASGFVVTGSEPQPWSFRGGVGYAYTTGGGTEINLRYDADARQGFLNQTASAKAHWRF